MQDDKNNVDLKAQMRDAERKANALASAENAASAMGGAVVPAMLEQIVQFKMETLFAELLKKHLPARVRELTRNYEPGAPPLVAQLDPLGQAYWGPIDVGQGGGGGSGGTWSGYVSEFYGAPTMLINVSAENAIQGIYVCYHTGLSPEAPKGGKEISGRWYWADLAPSDKYIVWRVAEEILDENGHSFSPKKYALVSGATCGDIKIPIPIPGGAYMVVQQGSDSENKVLATYARTHGDG